MRNGIKCRAIEFDKYPSLRYLISKRSSLLKENLHSVADAYLGGRDFYLPSANTPQSVLEATRVACRFPVIPYSYFAWPLIPCMQNHLYMPETCRSLLTASAVQPEGSGSIDGALLGLRYLNTLTSIANRHTRDHQHVLDIPPASTEQAAVEQLSMQSTVRQEGCDSSLRDHRVIYPDLCLRECALYGGCCPAA